MAKEEELKKSHKKEDKAVINFKVDSSPLKWLDYRFESITEDKLNTKYPLNQRFNTRIDKSINKMFDKFSFLSTLMGANILDLVISSRSSLSRTRPDKYPYFNSSKMVNTEWSAEYLFIVIPMEIRDFMLVMCENEHNFTYVCKTYRDMIYCELFKLTILNDYLLNELSDKELAVFKECEKVYLNSAIFPRGFENTPRFKVSVFMNMFYRDSMERRVFDPNDFLDKDWYGDMLYNRFKAAGREDMWFFYSNQAEMIERDLLTVYNLFKDINTNNGMELSVDAVEYRLLENHHFSKVILLLDLCEMIISYWNTLRGECAKKFNMDIINHVTINIHNINKVEESFEDSYMDHNEGLPFKEYVKNNDVYFKAGGITNFVMAADGQGALRVIINLSKIVQSMLDEWRNFTKDELFNAVKTILRHEMGHVVNDCKHIYANDLDSCRYGMKVRSERRVAMMKEYENTPEDQRLDHTYWYYTFLPEERAANAIMGLTIEEMYKSHNREIPDDIKKLLKENK